MLTRILRRIASLTLLGHVAACAPVSGDRAFFRAQEINLQQRGLFKTDRVARSAPYTANQLARNFRRVAFGSEFDIEDGTYVALEQDTGARMRRWAQPLVYALAGQATEADRAEMAAFAERLSRVTGLSITPAAEGADPNLVLHFLSPTGRAALAGRFREGGRDDPQQELFAAWAAAPTWPCAGEFYYLREGLQAHQIGFAVIYIRDELAGLYRQSCIEEEVAQVLGLARDHPRVRPSVFNDDEEYALLTAHDEDLFRILYDPRLRPGMTQAEAMPIVRIIARELRPAS